MAAPIPNNMPVNPDTTMITVKVAIDGTNRRFKVALRDLGANVFPDKLRDLLAIPSDSKVTFERYSDSAASYIVLDDKNSAIYKQLYRAAKAKLKLRIRATVTPSQAEDNEAKNIIDAALQNAEMQSAVRSRSNYLQTVLEPSTTTRSVPQSACGISLPNSTTETLVAAPNTEEVKAAPVQAMAENYSKPFLPSFHDFRSGVFCIDCNNCGSSIPNEHYHCSICDEGDFDLCMGCVDNNVTCGGEEHWLIKRTLQNGRVVSSVTETIAPKKPKAVEPEPEVVEPAPVGQNYIMERTCNSCVGDFLSNECVSCKECRDFDLCFDCLVAGLHGHNPSHTFVPPEDMSNIGFSTELITTLCKPGRDATHLAICDGCDKYIVGVRHKCLNCPDWDYCSACYKTAHIDHPGHRFAPLPEPIDDPIQTTTNDVHYGVYCDGPLCQGKLRNRSYIRGIRYKCALCHDTDFCASCEAHPNHNHDISHPLIKFKTPVKYVSVTTFGENPNGEKLPQMGDRVPRGLRSHTPTLTRQTRTAATETLPVAKSTHAATQVQIMADIKPVPSEPVAQPSQAHDLEARFLRDSTPDGTVLPPGATFEQVWTLTNPGPLAWPVGSSVRFIGGDSMLNLDANHPSSVSEIANATESNALERAIEAGCSADFKITMKSPSREGRVISYWRLKTPEGVPFGHKLWCDISVRSDPVEVKPGSSYVAPSVNDEHDDDSTKPEESSTMIFPKLDKESPVSSIHEEVKGEAAATAATESAPKSIVEDLLEDVESLELDEQSEDGFLTDEEYDILDASDEEFLNEAQKNVVTKK